MRSFTNFEKEIKQAVSQNVKEINPSENMFLEINEKMRSQNKEEYHMNLRGAKKTRGILVACALLVLTTVVGFAATKIVDYSGCLENKFESYPSEKQMKKVAGFVPKYIDTFENGYQFQVAFAGEYEGKDADENTTVMLKSAEFTYLKGDAELYLYTMEKEEGVVFENDSKRGEEIALLGDQKVYYDDFLNKIKPGDYVMTEQDKVDEANGTYVFSFGEDYDCIKHIQTIGWEENGISYSLECYDDQLTKAELLKMVEEVIRK